MSDPVLGMVAMWPSERRIEGWARCDGSSLPTQHYPALYAALHPVGHAPETFHLPSLADPVPGVHWVMAIHGVFIAHGAPRPRFEPDTVGIISRWDGAEPPLGCLFVAGQELRITDYQALYSLVGPQFGGDGRTTFKLPNLKPAAVVCHEGYYPQMR